MCVEGTRAHEILSYVPVEPGVARGGGGSTLLGPPVSTTRLPTGERSPVVGQNSVATLDSGRQRSEAGRQMPLVFALLGALSAALGARSDFVLENLALRQQLALLRRRALRPPIETTFSAWTTMLPRRRPGPVDKVICASGLSDLGSDNSIASSGCGSRSGGRGGAKRSMSFSRRPSFAGTGRASAPSGTGSPDAVEPVDRRSLARLQSSSAPWPSPIPSGARRASMVSSSSSVSTFHNAP